MRSLALLFMASCIASALAASVAAPAPGGEDESPPRVRVLYVPQGELDVLLEGGPRTMLLGFEEYLGLRRMAEGKDPVAPAPADAAMRRAEYELVVEGERARGRGRLDLLVLRDGLRKIPLPFAGLGVLDAKLDGAPAVLGRDGGGPYLVVEGEGEHRLDLEVGVRVEREDGDRFRVRGRLPAAARGFLELRLPGRQEARTAAPHRAVYPATEDLTIVGIHLDGSGAFDVRWWPRHTEAERGALLHADVRQMVLVEDDAVRLDAVATFDVFRRPVETLTLTVPSGVTVTDVRADGLLGWSDAAADGVRRVTLRFESPFSGRRSIGIRGEGSFPGVGDTDVPLVGCAEAARISGRLGVSFGADLSGRVVTAENVVRIDPASSQNRATGSLEAYEFWNADRRLRLRVERRTRTVKASLRTLLQLGETSRVLDVLAQYTLRGGRLYELSPRLPEGYAVTHVLVDGRDAGFTWEVADGGRLRVVVPAGFDAETTATLRVRAERDEPSWRDGGGEVSVAIPAVDAGDGVEQEGLLGVAAFSDFDVADLDVRGYEPVSTAELAAAGVAAINPVLAYRYRGAPGEGRLRVTRREPKVVGRVVTIVAPSRETVRGRARVDLDVLRAGIRRVRFRTRGGWGDALHVTGEGIQSTSRSDAAEAGTDIWTVTFQSLRRGTTGFDLEFERPVTDGLFLVPEIVLLDAAAVGTTTEVADQAGWIAVESSPGLQIEVTEPAGLTEVEAEEVPLPPGHAVAHGFVSAWRWVRPGYGMTLRVERFAELPVLQAVTTWAHLRTRISEDGLARTRLEIRLRNTDQQFLKVRLPQGSAPWAALVDGAPVKPLRGESDWILVPLPKAEGGAGEIPVVLVYETRLASLGGKDEIDLDPPDLGVAGTRFRWQVHLPDGYEVLRTDGAYRSRTRRDPPALVRFMKDLGLMMAGAEMLAADRAAPGASEAPTTAAPAQEPAIERSVDDGPMPDPTAQPAPRPVVPPDGPPPPAEREAGPPAPPTGGERTGEDAGTREGRIRDGLGSVGTYKRKAGVLSLDIEVVGGGPDVAIASSGPPGRLTLVYRSAASRATWSWLLAALVLVAGILVVRFRVLGPATWCVGVGALASTAPLLFDVSEIHLWDGVFAGAALGAAYFLGQALLRRAGRVGAAAGLLVLAIGLSATTASADPAPADDVETLVVPYDPEDPSSLDRIDQVLLPYATFVEMWNRAHPDRPIRTPDRLPVDVVLTGARYEGSVDGESLKLTATFGLYLPRDRWVEVSLPLAPAAVESATLDGEPTRVVSRKDALVAVVRKAGFHTLTLNLRARATRSGPSGAIDLSIPALPRSSFGVTVPGTDLRVDLAARGGVETVERDGRTSVEAVLGDVGRLRLAWAPKGPRRDGALSATAASRTLVSIAPGRIDLEAELALVIEGGSLSELVCDLGGGLVVRSVKVQHLLDWVQEGTELRLRFRPAVTGATSVRVTGGVETAGLEGIRLLPSVAPRGVLRESGRLGVHAAPGLTLVEAEVRALRRDAFTEAAWMNLGTKTFGPRRLAYRFLRRPVSLSVTVGRVRREVVATHRTQLHVGEDVVRGATLVEHVVRGRPLHELTLDVPADLEIERVTGNGVRTWWTDPAGEGRARLVVALAGGVVGRQQLVVTFRAPRGEGNVVALPAVRPVDADRVSGTVLLGAPMSLDLTVEAATGLRPSSAEGVAGVLPGVEAPRFAYGHDGGAWSISVATASRRARIRPLVTTRLVVLDDKLVVDTLFLYEIRNGGVRTFRVFVPEGEGEEMLWQVDGLRDRTESAETVDGVPGTVHRLTLQAEATGRFTVRTLYERKIDGGPLGFRNLRALDGEAGRSFVLVENRSDLVVTPDGATGLTEGQPADLPYLPAGTDASIYAFAWTAREDAWALSLRTRQLRFEAFDEAIVTLASLVTVVGPEGWSRNRMTYRVLNRSLQYLEVSLPANASLEAVLVGGQGVKPATRGPSQRQRVLVPLRRTALGEVSTEVVLVYSYEFPGMEEDGLAGASGLEAVAPVLHGLALQETFWEVRLPEGLDYSFDGNMEEVEADIAEVQEVLALEREVSFLSSVEVEGNEMPQARAGVNRYRQALALNDKVQTAIGNLQTKLETPVDDETRIKVLAKIDELNQIFDDNFTRNLAQAQTGETRQTAEQLRETLRHLEHSQMPQGPTAQVDQAGDVDTTLGRALRKSREILGKKQEVARGKAGLLKESWAANSMNPRAQQQAEEVARQVQQTARIQDLDVEVPAQVYLLRSTINPADMGTFRLSNFAEGAYDIRGFGGQPGQIVQLDDVTSGLEDGARALNNLGSARGRDPMSGAFFNDGREGDIRARTENVFDLELEGYLHGWYKIATTGGSGGGHRTQRIAGVAFRGPGGEVPPDMRKPGDPVPPATRAGVLSLDVPVPEGGRVYRFRKENGSPELLISVHDPSTKRRWTGLLWLAVALGAFLGIREIDRRRPFAGFRAVVGFVLALVCAIVWGTVIVSLLVMIACGALFALAWMRGRAATA